MRAKWHITRFIGGNPAASDFTGAFASDSGNREKNIVNLYPQVTFQQIDGFGGAITEAAGSLLKQMPPETRREIIRMYFAPEGIGYRMVRTHIDSCDFSLSSYSAADGAGGGESDAFSLARDEEYIIPFIRMADQAAGRKLPVMLTPWSPPAFMKTNGSRCGGKLRDDCRAAWAEYICRYIKEYRGRGLDVAMLSAQNEPNATQTWESCTFTAEEEKAFLRDYLHPALEKNGLGDIAVYIWDHNKERIFDRAAEMIDAETDGMIAGIAFHWYTGDHFDALELVRGRYPGKKLLFSEGCIEYSRFGENSQLQNAQMYAHDIIGNLRAGMNSFLDWNIVLDERGGPNHVSNFCEAPVIYDTNTGKLNKMLSFYYIEQFSRYILPGAVRVATTQYTEGLETVAFKNPGGELSIVLLNRGEQPLDVYLRLREQLLPLGVPAESICTVLIESIG